MQLQPDSRVLIHSPAPCSDHLSVNRDTTHQELILYEHWTCFSKPPPMFRLHLRVSDNTKTLKKITVCAAPKLEQYVRSTDIFSGDGSADSFQTVAIIVMVTKKTNHLWAPEFRLFCKINTCHSAAPISLSMSMQLWHVYYSFCTINQLLLR